MCLSSDRTRLLTALPGAQKALTKINNKCCVWTKSRTDLSSLFDKRARCFYIIWPQLQNKPSWTWIVKQNKFLWTDWWPVLEASSQRQAHLCWSQEAGCSLTRSWKKCCSAGTHLNWAVLVSVSSRTWIAIFISSGNRKNRRPTQQSLSGTQNPLSWAVNQAEQCSSIWKKLSPANRRVICLCPIWAVS